MQKSCSLSHEELANEGEKEQTAIDLNRSDAPFGALKTQKKKAVKKCKANRKCVA